MPGQDQIGARSGGYLDHVGRVNQQDQRRLRGNVPQCLLHLPRRIAEVDPTGGNPLGRAVFERLGKQSLRPTGRLQTSHDKIVEVLVAGAERPQAHRSSRRPVGMIVVTGRLPGIRFRRIFGPNPSLDVIPLALAVNPQAEAIPKPGLEPHLGFECRSPQIGSGSEQGKFGSSRVVVQPVMSVQAVRETVVDSDADTSVDARRSKAAFKFVMPPTYALVTSEVGVNSPRRRTRPK